MNAETCEQLVRAARADDRPAEIAKTSPAPAVRLAVAKLFAGLQSYVKLLYRGELERLGRRVGSSSEDVCTHVAGRMLEHPPRGSEDAPPLASVKTWVKTVALNYLRDLKRAQDRRGGPASAAEDGHGANAENAEDEATARQDARLIGQQLERDLRTLLEKCYPPGIAIYEASLDATTEADVELASSVETTVANVQARRSRMRKYCAAYMHILERPRSTDEQIAAAMNATLSANTQDIISKVRQFIALGARGAV